MSLWKVIKLARNLRKFAKGELEEGEILRFEKDRVWILGGIDAVPFPALIWGNFLVETTKIYGAAILGTIELAAKEAGFKVGKNALKVLRPEDAWKVDELMNYVGWGQIVKMEEKEDRIRIFMSESFDSRSIRSVKERFEWPACAIERGYIAGLLEAIRNKKCEVEEVRCQAKGDEICEFVFKFFEK